MDGAQANSHERVESKRVNFRDQKYLVSQVHGDRNGGFDSFGSSLMSEAETVRSATPDQLSIRLNTRDRMQSPSSGQDWASSNSGQPGTLRPYVAHWEARLERRASGISVRGRHGALQADGKVCTKESRRTASSYQQESESISHSSTTLTVCVLQLEQTQKREAHYVSTAKTSGERAKCDSAWHGTAAARSSPSSSHAEMEQDTRKPAAALRLQLVQDACRSESLRAHEYGSKSELLVAQTAPVSTIASTHEEKAVVTKGLLPQSLSRRPSQVSCRSSALGMSSVKSVSEAEAAKRSGRERWMQIVAREKYARAAMLASCDSES